MQVRRAAYLVLFTVLAIGCSSSDREKTKDKEGTTVPLPTKKASGTTTASTASASTTTSVTLPEPSASADAVAGAPRAGWPLPPVDCVMAGKVKGCRTAGQEPGVQCGDGACINPCPVGMAPDPGGMVCDKLCKSNADCRSGTQCGQAGTCNTPAEPGCEGGAICSLPGGTDMGVECNGKCVNPCKRGLNLYGGTQCAKHCKSPADCPGGECTDEFCTPLCPAEGCPYPWE